MSLLVQGSYVWEWFLHIACFSSSWLEEKDSEIMGLQNGGNLGARSQFGRKAHQRVNWPRLDCDMSKK